ncbi:hypothetical protein F5876DRAFT_81583 [Lentinula aff. lateritia]|uniref:Uncharacterized protein n=1 Tax=Lentinula aff. lateritia TaxID=2804960 RepID=A0ACC1TLL3_9AGAR|nr:hypothetical protein F5876DRAFT_81583 [Lentinula aff. lateritia]
MALAWLYANSEENTFFTTAQSFAPFSKSIAAIGQPHCHNHGFGPATVPTTSILPEAIEENQQFEYSTLYTGDGQPVQVLTPHCGQPPVVTPAQGHSITQIESPILQPIACRTGKQPQCHAQSQSPRDLPPHFDLDTGDYDEENPPVDPELGTDIDNLENQDLDDNSGNLLQGGPGGPSGPGGLGGPHTPISPDPPTSDVLCVRPGSELVLRLGLVLHSSPLVSATPPFHIKAVVTCYILHLQDLPLGLPKLHNYLWLGSPHQYWHSPYLLIRPRQLPHLLRPSLGKTRAGLLCQGFTFTNQQKVNYTLSYLSGSAKEWFVPDILDPDLDLLLVWTSSFKALVKELQDNFGIYDVQGETEDSLGNLKMKETENI